MINKFSDVILTVLVIAGITTVLIGNRPKGASLIIKSGGEAFSGVIRAATGQK
jgi:hypothetical protein